MNMCSFLRARPSTSCLPPIRFSTIAEPIKPVEPVTKTRICSPLIPFRDAFRSIRQRQSRASNAAGVRRMLVRSLFSRTAARSNSLADRCSQSVAKPNAAVPPCATRLSHSAYWRAPASIRTGWVVPDTYLHASNTPSGKYLHISGYSFRIGNRRRGDCRKVLFGLET